MWKRLLAIERPNANNYQDRIIAKAHKLAAAIVKSTKIEQSGAFGEFKVKSSKGDTFYTININQICEKQCRKLYCRVCKICIHRYKCTCPEYVVKNTLCKHIHLVRMYENGSDDASMLDNCAEILGENSLIKAQEQNEICEFVESKISDKQVYPINQDISSRTKIEREELHKWIDTLDDNSFMRFLGNIKEAISFENKVAESSETLNNKRKMEVQTYFPERKHTKKK